MQITDPKTERLIELDDYMKQESLYLNEEEFPFKVDHLKCLNCQQKTREEHSCLCFSCQWHLSGVGTDIKRNHKGRGQLRDIEFQLGELMIHGNSIYFDETSVSRAIELVEEEIANSKYEDITEKLIVQKMRLRQLERLGLEWESGY